MRELLDAIIAAPDDDAPRRVYADALLDDGDPLGELINIQLDLAAGGLPRADAIARRRRERELIREHRARWVAPLAQWLASPFTYRRGFVDEINIDTRVFAAQSEALLRAAPLLRGVVLENLTNAVLDDLRRALQSPVLSRLHGLSCVGELDAERALPILLDAVPRLDRLRALALFEVNDASRLVESGLIARLEELDLSAISDPTVTVAILDALERPLRRLVVSSGPDGGEVIAHPRVAEVEELSVLFDTSYTRAEATFVTKPFTRLRSLQVGHGDQVLATIATSRAFSKLVELDLGFWPTDTRGLAGATQLDALRVLRVRHRSMTANTVRALLELPIVQQLEVLDLRFNRGATEIRRELPKLFDGIVLASIQRDAQMCDSLYSWTERATNV